MPKNTKAIPVIGLPPEVGIMFTKMVPQKMSGHEVVQKPHRDNWHLLTLQVKGTTTMEVDFQKVVIKPSSVFYMHPNQVHRVISFKASVFYSLIIDQKHLKPEYLKLLEDLTPVQPLPLNKATFTLLSEIAVICMKLYEREDEKLYTPLLKDSCHTFLATILSQYLAQANQTDTPSRFDIISRSFKSLLEEHFATIKSPKEYAQKLNISTPYLNECVNHTTGHSVSHQIQQRIILEAERLLYHSNKSVKEIAYELGYEDHSYFIRLFAKVTGMTPLEFRSKNHE